MAELKYMTEYHTAFDPKTYLEVFYKTFEGSEHEKDLLQFCFKACHTFWSKFQPSSPNDSKETNIRCLEFGGGPSIANLISGSPKVDRIVFAEYTEANRKAVMSWIAGNPEAHNWSPLIEFFVRDLEGNDAPQAALNREEEVKRKIKSIVSCDVTKAPIVNLETADVGKPFDVVITSLCLEACVSSEQQYKNAVAELCKFLKPNGYLFMCGVLEQTFYTVGGEKFYTFPLTQTLVLGALTAVGMKDVNIETMETNYTEFQDLEDCRALFAVFGKKSAEVLITQ